MTRAILLASTLGSGVLSLLSRERQCNALDPKVLQEETVLPLNSKGPDFMRIRPQSVIADAPLVTLDRNERVRLMSKFRVLCRRSWVSKETGKHRGLVTRTAESVFGALLYLTEKYGRVFPSLEGLAHLAMCCKQSVVTAVADLEALGFVTRIRRIRRISTPLGFTTRQITNAYRVHEPAGGLGCVASTLFATESNYSTPSRSKFYSKRASDDSGPPAGTTDLASTQPRVCFLGGAELRTGRD